MSRKAQPGDYYVMCDKSGMRVPASQTVKEWTGMRVWRKYYEPRHPQDLLPAPRPTKAVKDARPPGTDYFLSTNEVQVSDL